MFSLLMQWTDGNGDKAHKVLSPFALLSEIKEEIGRQDLLYGALPHFRTKVVMRDEYLNAVNATLEVMMTDDDFGAKVLRAKDEEEDS